MRYSIIKIQEYSFILLCLFALIMSLPLTNAFAQSALAKPTINNVIPRDIFPGMFIMIEGKGLYSGTGTDRIIFSQGERIIKTYSDGGGTRENEVWGANVKVPQGLQPGVCKVEFEVGNQKSLPFFVNVSQTAKPPKLTSVSNLIVNPGYFVWVEGSGFSDNQTLEMTDAEGQKFTKTIAGVSTNNSLVFAVPASAYSGIAKFKVIENRNGVPQTSNEINFEIRSGPIPVIFNKDYFVSLSGGQWVELGPNDARPLYKATKIELKLIQGQKVVTSFISNFRRLHFEVPKYFQTGKMLIETRTWIDDDVSEWSKPLEFKITVKPAKPTFHNLETIPSKAEAMLKQNGETIAVSPIYFGSSPRVKIPKQIKRGNLEIYTRYWDKDILTGWKRAANFSDFDPEESDYYFYDKYDKEKSYAFNPFFEHFYFENNSSKFYKISRGNNLIIKGEFYVKSVNDLAMLLENGKEITPLKLSEFELLSGILVNIPNDMTKGDWRIWLIDKNKRLKTRLVLCNLSFCNYIFIMTI